MLKTIIVGAGAIAYAHARALGNCNAGIIGVYDVNRDSAARLAASSGAPVLDSPEAYEKAVADADMVHLCTPPGIRIGYAETAMRAGCHIITEKPVAAAIEDAQTLVNMAKKYGVMIMVDYNHRFRDGFQKLLGIVRDGVLGDVIDHSSWSSHIKNGARGVIGSKGAAILEGDDLFDFSRLRLKTESMEHEEVLKLNDTYNLDTCNSYTNATRHFLDCIAAKKESSASGAYALETLKVSHAILQAAATQQTVALA